MLQNKNCASQNVRTKGNTKRTNQNTRTREQNNIYQDQDWNCKGSQRKKEKLLSSSGKEAIGLAEAFITTSSQSNNGDSIGLRNGGQCHIRLTVASPNGHNIMIVKKSKNRCPVKPPFQHTLHQHPQALQHRQLGSRVPVPSGGLSI